MGKIRNKLAELGRRERQIMEVVHRLGEASVSEVRAQLADPPSYSSVRTMVRHLESKGYLRHRQEGVKYVYRPTESQTKASRSALQSLLSTFFRGSASDAMAALIEVSGDQLSEADLERVSELVEQERQRREGQ